MIQLINGHFYRITPDGRYAVDPQDPGVYELGCNEVMRVADSAKVEIKRGKTISPIGKGEHNGN